MDLEGLKARFLEAQVQRCSDSNYSLESLTEVFDHTVENWAKWWFHDNPEHLPTTPRRTACGQAAALYVTARDKGIPAAVLLKLTFNDSR